MNPESQHDATSPVVERRGVSEAVRWIDMLYLPRYGWSPVLSVFCLGVWRTLLWESGTTIVVWIIVPSSVFGLSL
jgi:hypothetical protein